MVSFTLFLILHLSRDEMPSRDKMHVQSILPQPSLHTVCRSVSPAPSFLPSAWLWMFQKGNKHWSSVQEPLRERWRTEYSCQHSQVKGIWKTNIRNLPTVPEQVTAVWKESWSQCQIGEIPDFTLTHLQLWWDTETDDWHSSCLQHHSFLLRRRTNHFLSESQTSSQSSAARHRFWSKSNLHKTEKHIWG